ncbi:hypothetical protein T484DRAFT_1852295 [Baffinella frigidus]|nr:hypothetical protein T484DRAFT_1852295 [Cryptophyta sp. CCMP2293]
MLLMTSTAVETLAEVTSALVKIRESVPTESLLFDLKLHLFATQQAHAKLVKHMETEMADYNWHMTRYEVSPRTERPMRPAHPTDGIQCKTNAFIVSMLVSHCDAVKALIPEFAARVHGHSCIGPVKRDGDVPRDCKVACKVDCNGDHKVDHKRKRTPCESRLSLVAAWGDTDSRATKAARLDTLEVYLGEAHKVQQGLFKLIEKRVENRGGSWGGASLSNSCETTDANQRTYAKWFLNHASKIEDKIATLRGSGA